MKKNSTILLTLCVFVAAAVCVSLFMMRSCGEQSNDPIEPVVAGDNKVVQEGDTTVDGETEKPLVVPDLVEDVPIKKNFFNHDSAQKVSAAFLEELNKISSKDDFITLIANMGIEGLDEKKIETLYFLLGDKAVNINQLDPLVEIGELKRKQKVRMALLLKDKKRVFFDVEKGVDGNWKISAIFPEKGDVMENQDNKKEGLVLVYDFVSFAINKEFKKAKVLTDPSKLSDVQFAGMCIIFEEGGYKLRSPRGVLNSIYRPVNAGYSVYLTDTQAQESQFSIILNRSTEKDDWRVVELNFDKLLSSLIKKNGGGVYYSPFVKNPKGGDSIVVYFDFNTETLSLRTRRQLNIVANILKWDDSKKLTLTGHTDSVGGDSYNRTLSNKRANAVKKYLVSEGVKSTQIKTIGYGKQRPRQANTLDDGSDNPEGRKANRRTEIYLDF